MKKTLLMVSVIIAVMAIMTGALATDTNHVSYWCEDGVKYEPVDTPFHVPEPATGTVWSLLILKAGSGDGQNETWDYPDVGGWYSHSSGKDNSHAILCIEEEQTTTTVPDTTTTVPDTTTTVPDTTTTVPDTTTTIPETTTTVPETTTTVPEETTTVPPTTRPPTTTIPEVSTDIPELPYTGIETGWFLLAGASLLIAGLAALGLTTGRREN